MRIPKVFVALFWSSITASVPVLAAAPISATPMEPSSLPVALARGGSGGICHCPCKINNCDCTLHSESCHRCYGIALDVPTPLLAAILSSSEPPVLESRDADWFEAGVYPELRVKLEATMSDTGQKEATEIRFLPDPADPARYVPDKRFNAAAYATWVSRVDRRTGGSLSVGAKDDPATWRILDGDASHLNQSLQKSFQLVRSEGRPVEVFRSESTLGWEAILYLRAVVAGIPEEALLLNKAEARTNLVSLVELIDLQMKAGDSEGAIRSLDGLIGAAGTRWLDPAHEGTPGAICGFRKIRNLLEPGSSCS
jgi:hypothetical protein